MNERDFDTGAHWHSPDRAWAPLMWIIGAVVLSVSAILLAPLVPVLAAAASGTPPIVKR